jgi:Flp pilus assembly protein TadG
MLSAAQPTAAAIQLTAAVTPSQPRGGGRAVCGVQAGQALVEFALVSIFLALLLGAVIEFGFLFAHKIELVSAARAGARWGAGHSTAWSSAASPASTTIEGQVLAAGGTSTLTNDDSHLAIDYLAVSGSTTTVCGHYSAGGGAFVAAGGYTQATCVVAGNLVRVTLTKSFALVTGLLGQVGGAAVTVSSTGSMVMTS